MRFALIALLLFIFLNPTCAFAEQNQDEPCEIILLIERSFGNPILITVSRSIIGDSTIKADKYSGIGSGSGKVLKEIETKISKEKFTNLYEKILKLDFKQIYKTSAIKGGFIDGSTWTLKLDKGGSSISLSVWSPTRKEIIVERGLQEFVSYATELISLSKLNLHEDLVSP